MLSLDLIERFLDRVDKKHQEDLDKEKEKKSDEKEGDDKKSDEKKEGLNEEVDDLSVFPYHCVYNLTCVPDLKLTCNCLKILADIVTDRKMHIHLTDDV